MQEGFSEYAEQIADLVRDKRRKGPVYGLCVHTSGSGPLRRAKKTGRRPDEIALDYYDSAKYSTHFVAGHKGLYQITDAREQVSHIGYTGGIGGRMSASRRRQWYHSGQWAKAMPKFTKRWRQAWIGRSSPSALHPSKFPNADYVAIELLPCTLGFGLPLSGFRYSMAQHVAVAVVALELAEAFDWPERFEFSGRLAGHEDLGPHNRVGPAGRPKDGEAWDPGRHREKPWISWPSIQEWIRAGRKMGLPKLAGMMRAVYETSPDR